VPRSLCAIVPDRPGAGAELLHALAAADVNIEGACESVRKGETWGAVHLFVEDPAMARTVIEAAGFEVDYDREVRVMELEDRPGALAEVLATMAADGANVELFYFASRNRLVISTEDMLEHRFGVKSSEARYP
jgi:hypothetical protein